MRKIIVAGNWKMNKNLSEALDLFKAIDAGAKSSGNLQSVLVFPSFPFLIPLKQSATNECLHLGAQNIASENSGAFTGEVSAAMIKSLGIDYTLIGHSERRQFFGENGVVLKRKIDLALEHNLTPIFCCGESLEERKSNRHESVIKDQLLASTFHLSASDFSKLIIAYEPVWAIGTGETATSDQAESMHGFIRKLILEKYGNDIAEKTHILYGGSCNAGNAKELFSRANVDGGLIGGASLKADEFLKIISIVNE